MLVALSGERACFPRMQCLRERNLNPSGCVVLLSGVDTVMVARVPVCHGSRPNNVLILTDKIRDDVSRVSTAKRSKIIDVNIYFYAFFVCVLRTRYIPGSTI